MKKGFTLIELLVVIAIIGILAAIVLVNLNAARQNAQNTSAIGSLSSMRAAAELEATAGGNYPDHICETDGPLANLVTAVTDIVGTAAYVCGNGETGPGGGTGNVSAWAAEIELLPSDSDEYFCVDSSGFAGPSNGGLEATDSACTPEA